MSDLNPTALKVEAGKVWRNPVVSALVGIAFSASSTAATFAADGSPLPIKSVTVDAQKDLVVKFTTHVGVFPGVPHLLDLPGPNHRVVLDFANASIEKNVLATPEDLSKEISQQVPAIKDVRYSNLTNTPKPTARLVVDLPEAVAADPRVVKLDENSVTVSLGEAVANATAATTTSEIQTNGSDQSVDGLSSAMTASSAARTVAAVPNNIGTEPIAVAPASASDSTAIAPPAAAQAAAPDVTATPAATDAPVAAGARGVAGTAEPTTTTTIAQAGSVGGKWDWNGGSAMTPTLTPNEGTNTTVAQTQRAASSVDGVAPAQSAPTQIQAQPVDVPELKPAITESGDMNSSTDASAASKTSVPEASDIPISSAPPPTPAAAAPKPAQPASSDASRSAAVKLYNSAVKNHLSGKLADAIADYKGALAADPELAEAHSNLGLIYNQQHDYTNALAEFRKALAVNPRDAITYNGIGAALRAEHDLSGAIKNWQTAVQLDSHLATAYYNLGTAYELQKDSDKAFDAYQQAVKNDYRLGEAYYRMGLILERKHKNEDAVAQFKEALKASGNSEYSKDARQRLAMLDKSSPAPLKK